MTIFKQKDDKKTKNQCRGVGWWVGLWLGGGGFLLASE